MASTIRKVAKASLVTLAAALIYPQINSRIDIQHLDTPENKSRLLGCPTLLKGRFFPTFYLPYGFAQAIFAAYSRHGNPTVAYTTEMMTLSNGAVYRVDYGHLKDEAGNAKENKNEKKALIILLPGLSATSDEPYMNNIASECLENNYKVVVFNNRWNGGTLTLSLGTPLCFYEDFKHFVRTVAAKYPEHELFAIGHSYGANTLVNYLGEFPEEKKLKGAVAVACPFDMHRTARWLQESYAEDYIVSAQKLLVSINEKELLSHYNTWGIDHGQLMKMKRGREIDENFTRKLMGYRSATEYYKGISSVNRIHNVSVPLLMLSSKDDPIIHPDCIAYEECKRNPNIILAVTNTGGHVGWFEGFFQPKRWFPKPVVEFVDTIWKEKHEIPELNAGHQQAMISA